MKWNLLNIAITANLLGLILTLTDAYIERDAPE